MSPLPVIQVDHVDVHILDERPGYWCHTCCAPTVSELDTSLIDRSDLTVVARDTVSVCTTCDYVAMRERSDTR